ncbi:hypothetical protein P280DRAFT_471667 [Massarina eburnea CBS 473.64]|uniref:Uncharacterized protein n=1 Tax=Massarina eburnea CBS 473.64 TaxID=1395130 RepID=A0A6A6RRD1_9PLEO|nr:hypothetical protein P280DRAFT_471667 [Massarina eburnea CBS 473.64]
MATTPSRNATGYISIDSRNDPTCLLHSCSLLPSPQAFLPSPQAFLPSPQAFLLHPHELSISPASTVSSPAQGQYAVETGLG